VVGGGKVGTRKAIALLEAGAAVRVISPEVTAELADAGETHKSLVINRRTYGGADDIGECQIVFAATNSSAVNAQVSADARSRFRLASVADAPTDGSFISMAVHRAGPVAIGVSAGNVPTAAGRIRDAIAARIDDRYGDAVAACAQLRAEVLAEGGSAEWGRIHPTLIGSDFCARVESETLSEEIAACRS
jgi:uroporphyrin-III C-methyltransferase/precorrin-2 dehydrogenase/sirohydrochlorin ferrochelatase